MKRCTARCKNIEMSATVKHASCSIYTKQVKFAYKASNNSMIFLDTCIKLSVSRKFMQNIFKSSKKFRRMKRLKWLLHIVL